MRQLCKQQAWMWRLEHGIGSECTCYAFSSDRCKATERCGSIEKDFLGYYTRQVEFCVLQRKSAE
jgi:hypothetical protein